jgi:hypothetical protein
MEAWTTRLDTLTHDQGQSPQTREHGNRPVAVMGHPEELTTLVTMLFQRGQGHFMRRFGACASSSHRSSPVVDSRFPFLLGYTCCQPEIAIQRFFHVSIQLFDIPVAWANWARVQWGCRIISRRRLARAA